MQVEGWQPSKRSCYLKGIAGTTAPPAPAPQKDAHTFHQCAPSVEMGLIESLLVKVNKL